MRSKHFPLLISVMIVLVALASSAAASNWTQFQKDEKHTGITADPGPRGTDLTMDYDTNLSNGMIDTVPVILGDYVYVEGASKLFKYDKNCTYVADREISATGDFQNACLASDNNNTIYVVDSGSSTTLQPKIIAINADTMTEKWSTSFGPAEQQCSCPITYYNDKLFVGTVRMSGGDPLNLTDDGTYYAFNASTGQEIWNLTTNTGGGYYWAGAAVVGSFIVYPDDSGYLTSVNISTGNRINQTRLTTNQIRSSATYNADNNLIYVASKDKKVYSTPIDPSTGTFNSTGAKNFTMYNTSTSTPAYNANGHRIYVACGASSGATNYGYVYCLNATTLNSIWNNPVSLSAKIQSSPAVAYNGSNDPMIFVTGNDGNGGIYRIKDTGTSASLITGNPTNYTYSLAGVAISGNYAYYGNDKSHLYRFS